MSVARTKTSGWWVMSPTRTACPMPDRLRQGTQCRGDSGRSRRVFLAMGQVLQWHKGSGLQRPDGCCSLQETLHLLQGQANSYTAWARKARRERGTSAQMSRHEPPCSHIHPIPGPGRGLQRTAPNRRGANATPAPRSWPWAPRTLRPTAGPDRWRRSPAQTRTVAGTRHTPARMQPCAKKRCGCLVRKMQVAPGPAGMCACRASVIIRSVGQSRGFKPSELRNATSTKRLKRHVVRALQEEVLPRHP